MQVSKLISINLLFLSYQVFALGFEPVEVRVAGKEQYSSFGIFNESPESPDSPMIAYIIFDRAPIDKKLIEVLAGLGNHTTVSPDRMWFAAETDYRSDPVELRVFRRGHTEPAALIFSHSFTDLTWKKRAHVNPSFSRDGKRLYYNRAVSENLKQAYYCDLSALISVKKP